MRLFVKAKQVTKHCLEIEGIPLNYNINEFDGSIILAAQTPILKRVPSTAYPPTAFTNKYLQPFVKEFICSIWLVLVF
jgi:hypothetical protein